MKSFAILSSRGGSGRTLLAANLAAVLAGDRESKVLILEIAGPEKSDLALHRGSEPDAGPTFKPGAVEHVCVPTFDALQAHLTAAEKTDAWVLLDGLELSRADWKLWVSAFQHLLLVERADLSGCRRMPQLLRAVEAEHWPMDGLLPVWMGEQSAQPLPATTPAAQVLPWYPKAVESLAQGSLPALDDAKSPFSKSLHAMASRLGQLRPFQATSDGFRLPESTEQDVALLQRLRRDLRATLDLAAAEARNQGKASLKAQWEPRVRAALEGLLAKEDASWLDQQRRGALVERLIQETLGLGPLEDLLRDPEISEIMVNHPGQIYVERAGRLSLSTVQFEDERQLRTIIERMVAPLGRRIDESSPKVDARLPDGSRINAIIPPLALKGPCLTVRKFPAHRLGMEELVSRGALSAVAARFLKQAVEARKNILVSGGTGSGKTTLLNALSAYIPEGERIVTIEDSAELKLQQSHVVTLEARPANLEGQGEVSIRDLLVNSLRMRPDRIVIGECRGGEALDMLQAMNTGHEGSLSTLHANNPRDALQRLETLCLMSGIELPLLVVRRQVASAVDLILQIGRLRDGSRRVLSITELTGMEGDVMSTQEIFAFDQVGIAEDGRVLGELRATGVPAKLYQQLKARGEAADFSVFERV